MLALLALLVPLATAGDQALYERAVQLIDDHYLRPETISATAMFTNAGEQLEGRIEWLLVDATPGTLALRDGQGDWHAEVRLAGDADLPAALSRLEDAVHAAKLPLDADVDVRVEILRGVARTLDRHSVVLHADGLERFDERLSGTLTGVGATVGEDDSGLYVEELIGGGPAERDGLRVGDRVVQIDGVSTVGMVPGDATDRIRGPAGTEVILTVRRGTQTFPVQLRREEITIRNVVASRGPHDVGVITIEHFSEQTRPYLMAALGELAAQGLLANGVVIDLRGNTGGSLLQSAEAADTFLQSGLIVRTVGRDGVAVPSLVPRIEAHAEQPGYTMPIAVLMDHSTASGSEILAGALAHLDRAVLVGTNSFGKGTVQKVYQLSDDIKLKLTVAEYLLDGGTHVMDVGLQPDVALEGVRFYPGGVWFPSPTRERMRLPPGTPVVRHLEDEDDALELAAALVSGGAPGTRTAVLAAAGPVERSLATAADAKVVEAFRARDIDWTAAPGPVEGEPVVDVSWSFAAPPSSGGTGELRATVINRGPPLARAALRLASTDPAWDDLVLPLGRLDHGATRTGAVQVQFGAVYPTRTDRLAATLEADGVSPRPVPGRDLTVVGEATPPLAVTARAWPTTTPGELRVTLDVDNRGDALLSDVEARFAFPKVPGIELVDASTAPVSLAAHATARLELRLKLAPTWTDAALPLHLVVTSDGFPRLVDWPVTLPREGSVKLEAPTVVLEPPPTILPVGTTRLHVRATDDRALDHVVVYAGPETMNRTHAQATVEYTRNKVAWRSTTARHTDLDVALPVVAGTNHYVVVAEDRTGLRTQRDLYVLGDDGGVDVSAD